MTDARKDDGCAGVVSTERDVEQCVCAVRPAGEAQSAKQQCGRTAEGLVASHSAAATAGTLLEMQLQTSLASGIYSTLG